MPPALMVTQAKKKRAGEEGGPDPCPFSIQSKLCPRILQPILKECFEN